MRQIILAVVAFAVMCVNSISAEESWVEHRAPDLGFAVLFPQPPQISSTRNQSRDKTLTYTQNTFFVSVGDREYMMAMFEYPSGTLPRNPDEKYWAGRVADFASGSSSVVQGQKPQTLAGHPGVEAVTANAKDVSFLLNMVLTGDRLYALASSGPKGHDASPDAIRFRDSFQLISK